MYIAHMNIVKHIKLIAIVISANYPTVTFAYDPYDCLNYIANIDSEITIGLATELCSGSWSPEPVKCYQGISQIDDDMPRGIAQGQITPFPLDLEPDSDGPDLSGLQRRLLADKATLVVGCGFFG